MQQQLQQKVVDNLKAAMDEAQQSANEYGPPKDRYDSFRMQQLRKKRYVRPANGEKP